MTCWCGQQATEYYQTDSGTVAVCTAHSKILRMSMRYASRTPSKGEERHDAVHLGEDPFFTEAESTHQGNYNTWQHGHNDEDK